MALMEDHAALTADEPKVTDLDPEARIEMLEAQLADVLDRVGKLQRQADAVQLCGRMIVEMSTQS